MLGFYGGRGLQESFHHANRPATKPDPLKWMVQTLVAGVRNFKHASDACLVKGKHNNAAKTYKETMKWCGRKNLIRWNHETRKGRCIYLQEPVAAPFCYTSPADLQRRLKKHSDTNGVDSEMGCQGASQDGEVHCFYFSCPPVRLKFVTVSITPLLLRLLHNLARFDWVLQWNCVE